MFHYRIKIFTSNTTTFIFLTTRRKFYQKNYKKNVDLLLNIVLECKKISYTYWFFDDQTEKREHVRYLRDRAGNAYYFLQKKCCRFQKNIVGNLWTKDKNPLRRKAKNSHIKSAGTSHIGFCATDSITFHSYFWSAGRHLGVTTDYNGSRLHTMAGNHHRILGVRRRRTA